ncbi:MATE family efflux transporter [Butyrivibrio sp. YAB3001]|uniref:MATE family efflux transporter n=1 Tax=Butyrivibrio sp. YAB3001 TaxID=1520812 RepID=UPI0008F63881|nr:MATE family efflux transporter [Butyrivibrio sp. YAB3001]SFB73746.1 putative efflux protein, MATE family [Butyrivibrio sp. YAB3001]
MANVLAKKYSKDMTVGVPATLILSFMLPMMMGNIFQQFYNIVDTIIAGRFIDAKALAAVGSTGHITNLFFALGNGLATGIGILVSQSFGSGDMKSVKKVITNAFVIVSATAIFVGLLGFAFSRLVLEKLLKTPDTILDNAVAYMSIICLGFVGTALYNTISYIMRGIGDSKTPLYFLIVSSFLNVLMDLLYVIVFKMGVVGLAVATITAQALSAAGSITYAFVRNSVFKIGKDDWGLDKDIIVRCYTLGGSMALQSGFIALSFVILQRVINSFDYIVMAAFTTTSKIENLVNMQFKALQDSLSTYTGQNIGAKKGDRVKMGFKSGMTMMVIYVLVMIPVMAFFGKYFVRVFIDSSETEIIAFGSTAMRILSSFYLPLGCIYVCRGILNGAGDAKFPLISGIAEMTGRIIFPAFFCSLPFLGAWGLWISTGVTWTIVGGTALARYFMKDWRKGLF